MHRVKLDAEAACKQLADCRKIKQRLHQFGVVIHCVDHFNRHLAQLAAADHINRHIGSFQYAVLADGFALGKNRLGYCLGGGAAVAAVELDAEIAIRPAGIMAGRQNNAAEGMVFADHARSRRGGEDAALSDHDLAQAVGRRHLQDNLHRLAVVVAAIAAQHQGRTLRCGDAVEDGLHEIFKIIRLLEGADFFAQSRGAGLLVGKGLGGDGAQAHGVPYG